MQAFTGTHCPKCGQTLYYASQNRRVKGTWFKIRAVGGACELGHFFELGSPELPIKVRLGISAPIRLPHRDKPYSYAEAVQIADAAQKEREDV